MNELEALLERYRKYDFLNENRTPPLIKIFVSYIKPSFLFKSRILTPIHLGRSVEREASKDGQITETDIEWLHANCLGDSDCEGSISSQNRRIGFFTGTYWAWKNYDKLGDPEYFGNFGYRKLLDPSFLDQLPRYDAVLPALQQFNCSLIEQFCKGHGKDYLKMLLDVKDHCFTEEEKNDFERYARSNMGYFHELYVLKKPLFDNFCRWISPKIFYLLKKYPDPVIMKPEVEDVQVLLRRLIGTEAYAGINTGERRAAKSVDCRDIAFLVERLTGFWLYENVILRSMRYTEAKVHNFALQISNNVCKAAIIRQMRLRMRAK